MQSLLCNLLCVVSGIWWMDGVALQNFYLYILEVLQFSFVNDGWIHQESFVSKTM